MSHSSITPSIETLIIEIPEVPIPRLNSKMKLSQKIDELKQELVDELKQELVDEPKQELVDEPKQELPSQEIVFRLTPRRNK
jgi:hypothetical protein